jgi:hypothetical protein
MKEKNPAPQQTQTARHQVRMPGFLIEQDIGLGDVIKKATYAVGIKPCAGCERRAEVLNRWVRFTR